MARVLRPQSIAIIGASADARSFGGFVQGNLQRFGYAGALHLVSRSSSQINGLACVATVDELPSGIDLAVLAIPESGVLPTIGALAAKRCHAAVLFASGYAEAGEAGQAAQRELMAAAGSMLINGPNCMGFTNFVDGVAVTFEPLQASPPPPVPAIAVLAQSGFMAATMRDALVARGLPLSHVFSTGNEAGLGIEDMLAHELQDDSTALVAVYAEQVRRPALFLQLAQQARAVGKPIVMLMPGRSARARVAALSHTGALAGDHATASALLRRQGVALCETLDELFDVSAVLLRYPRVSVGGTAFVTGSGAMKNIALDMADSLGLALPDLAVDTVARLKAQLPSFALAENPLDYTTIGVRQPGLIGEILGTLAADPNIAQLCLAIPLGPAVAQRDKATHIVPALAALAKPAVLVVTGDGSAMEPFFADAIRECGVPFFRSADRALRALRCVAERAAHVALAQRCDAQRLTHDVTMMPLSGTLPANGIYAEYQGKAWLRALGVAVPASALVGSVDDALAQANQIGWPVVIKAQHSTLPHKTEVGGVIVGIHNDAALRDAWVRLNHNIAHHRPGLLLDGVLVEAMSNIKAANCIELVVGAKRDAAWGPVLMLGLGGVWIEVLKDVRLFAADLSVQDIVAELQSLKAAPLLAGVRGAPGVDLLAVAQVVARIGGQMLANPHIVEIDINPLVATPQGAFALDALVVIDGLS